MRYFTTAIILAALFMIGFTATPASAKKHGAKCAALIKKVEDNKENFQTDLKIYSKIAGMLQISKAAQENGKKKKCEKVAKKALNLMGL